LFWIYSRLADRTHGTTLGLSSQTKLVKHVMCSPSSCTPRTRINTQNYWCDLLIYGCLCSVLWAWLYKFYFYDIKHNMFYNKQIENICIAFFTNTIHQCICIQHYLIFAPIEISTFCKIPISEPDCSYYFKIWFQKYYHNNIGILNWMCA
jgi:hypothetical protein